MKQKDLFGFDKIELSESEKKYSHKIQTPIYTPRENGGGNIHACYDDQKYLRLLRLIETSNVSVTEKKF